MKQQVFSEIIRVSEVVSKCSDPESIRSNTPAVGDGLFSCDTENKGSVHSDQSDSDILCP